MPAAPDFPEIGLGPGRRVAVFGAAGSGKSYLCKWIILRSDRMRWIILDTKHEPLFDEWHPIDGLPSMDQLIKLWKDMPRVVVRPTGPENNRDTLDLFLSLLHETFDRFGVYIDETYQVALGIKPCPGFTGLVTRGRVRGQTVIMGSQRPAWIPKFAFTEANYYCVLRLGLKQDRLTVADMTDDDARLPILRPIEDRYWLCFNTSRHTLKRMAPVTIIKSIDTTASR